MSKSPRNSRRSSNSASSVFLSFVPKSGTPAEYTFYPSSNFRKECGGDSDDVGFFLRDNEILQLKLIGEKTIRGRLFKMPIREGAVTIHSDEWREIADEEVKSMVEKDSAEVHPIDQITREYLSD